MWFRSSFTIIISFSLFFGNMNGVCVTVKACYCQSCHFVVISGDGLEKEVWNDDMEEGVADMEGVTTPGDISGNRKWGFIGFPC